MTVQKTMAKLLGSKEQFLLDPGSPETMFLKDLMTSFGPSGHEDIPQRILKEYATKNTNAVSKDVGFYNDVMLMLNPDADKRFAFAAHADKIGYVVLRIEDNGMIRVSKLGGSNPQIALGKFANLLGDQGLVRGIFTWPAIHIINQMEKKPFEATPERLTFDAGFRSRKQAEDAGVYPGCPIMLESGFDILNNNYIVGVADNQIGTFISMQALRVVEAMGISIGVSLLNTSQEEVGLKGSTRMANHMSQIGVEAVLFTDVCHDTSGPHTNRDIHGDINGDHVAIAVGPSVARNFGNKVFQIAMDAGLEPQRYAAANTPYLTGTDLDPFAEKGIPSALISTPVRYMHSPVERLSISVVYDAIRVMAETAMEFDRSGRF